jgi:predicted GNAT family acetyltransferase
MTRQTWGCRRVSADGHSIAGECVFLSSIRGIIALLMLTFRDVARLEEARAARQLAELVTESRPFAGGVAGYSGPGTFHNRVLNAGLVGSVSDEELDALVEFYRRRDVPAAVELCPFADPGLLAGLAGRGFVLREFKQLMHRPLQPHESLPSPPLGWPARLEVREFDRGSAGEVEQCVKITMSGFFAPGQAIPEPVLDVARRVTRLGHTRSFLALVDGVPAGAGSMDLGDQVAHLQGTSVLPEFRQRGVQQALMLTRLARAAEHGCRIATRGSRPGTSTERNAQRLGFGMAYSKAVVVRSAG